MSVDIDGIANAIEMLNQAKGEVSIPVVNGVIESAIDSFSDKIRSEYFSHETKTYTFRFPDGGILEVNTNGDDDIESGLDDYPESFTELMQDVINNL